MKTILHNHSKATPSDEADLLEKEIEIMEKNLDSLVRELTVRLRRAFNVKRLYQHHKIFLALCALLVIDSVLSGRKRRTPKCKVVVRYVTPGNVSRLKHKDHHTARIIS